MVIKIPKSKKSRKIIIISIIIIIASLFLILSPFMNNIFSYFTNNSSEQRDNQTDKIDEFELLHNDPARKALPEEYVYNNLTFTKTQDYFWNTTIKLKENDVHVFVFRYSPLEVENIFIDNNSKQNILKNKLYITLSGNLSSISVLAFIDLGQITGTKHHILNIPTFPALADKDNGNVPLITCDNTTNETGVIYLKLGNKTKIYSKNNGCVVVQGTNEVNILKATYRLIFELLEVIKK